MPRPDRLEFVHVALYKSNNKNSLKNLRLIWIFTNSGQKSCILLIILKSLFWFFLKYNLLDPKF